MKHKKEGFWGICLIAAVEFRPKLSQLFYPFNKDFK